MTEDLRKSGVDQKDKCPIESKEFAAIIVDALKDAGLINQDGVEQAIAIVAEEIDVRRALGDG